MRLPLILTMFAAGAAAAPSEAPPAATPGATTPAAAEAPALPHKMCSGDDLAPTTARLMPGYGKGGFPIRTKVPTAQAFFDNGMQLGHAFAHSASVAAFTESARRDPGCAMCLWGKAWAAGPTINYTIDKAEEAKLAADVANAERLVAGGPEKERLLVAALKLRYRDGGGKGAGDDAFARAMDALAVRYPDDDEIAVIAADAWMIPDSNRWRTDHLARAITLLETVLKRDPDYTPAIHFYIHATEMTGVAAKAEPYADRLQALAPAASHLVHMPSHTYFHIGRYQDAVDANVRAVAIGRDNARRLGLPEPDGVWDLPYHAHNVQYGVGGALISGDGASALALSDPLVARVAADTSRSASPYTQLVAGTAYFAEARFADPRKVLALPSPPASLRFARAYWHYARGEAAARLGDVPLVRAEAAAIPISFGRAHGDDGSDVAARMAGIARRVLDGRAALLEGKPERALAAFRAAAKLQETEAFLAFSDPPAFWYPVRRDVAAAQLAAGRPKEALAEADATLRMMPREPATLAIRAKSLAALGRTDIAAAERRRAVKLFRGDLALLETPGLP